MIPVVPPPDSPRRSRTGRRVLLLALLAASLTSTGCGLLDKLMGNARRPPPPPPFYQPPPMQPVNPAHRAALDRARNDFRRVVNDYRTVDRRIQALPARSPVPREYAALTQARRVAMQRLREAEQSLQLAAYNPAGLASADRTIPAARQAVLQLDAAARAAEYASRRPQPYPLPQPPRYPPIARVPPPPPPYYPASAVTSELPAFQPASFDGTPVLGQMIQ